MNLAAKQGQLGYRQFIFFFSFNLFHEACTNIETSVTSCAMFLSGSDASPSASWLVGRP